MEPAIIYEVEKTEELITLRPKQHKHTMIWLHGLNCSYESNLNHIIEFLGKDLQHVKVLIPNAPIRYVTLLGKQTRSWYDVKSRGKQSFQVPFQEAFSSAQIYESYEKILKPLIQLEKEKLKIRNDKGLLIIAGFSQGCGLALHSYYESDKVDAGLAISGYMFEITKFDPNINKPLRLIYGLNDKVRPWEYTKVTYEGKIPLEKFKFVPKMGHQVSSKTQKEIRAYLNELLA